MLSKQAKLKITVKLTKFESGKQGASEHILLHGFINVCGKNPCKWSDHSEKTFGYCNETDFGEFSVPIEWHLYCSAHYHMYSKIKC